LDKLSQSHMVTIEEFLDRKNPVVDSKNTLPGPNTVSTNYSNISGVEDWEEFYYQTLRNLYGETLDLGIALGCFVLLRCKLLTPIKPTIEFRQHVCSLHAEEIQH